MFRFTIRELVLLTLVVAMGAGWWLDRLRLQVVTAERDEAHGAMVRFAYSRFMREAISALSAKSESETASPPP